MAENASISVKKGKLFQTQSKFLNYEEWYIYIYILYTLLGLVSFIFLLIEILNGVQVRQVCWPIKHSNTMVIEPAFGTFGSVSRSCWKIKSASP